MKLKGTKAQREYLNKPIPVTEKDWEAALWAVIFFVSLSGILYLVGK